jgi:hypothetical protein
VFENRVPRRIFGPKRDEIIGGWRKLHSEELHNLHSSPNIIIMIKSEIRRFAGHVAHMGVKMKAYMGFGGKPRRKRRLGRPRHRWKDNVKRNRREIEWGGMD